MMKKLFFTLAIFLCGFTVANAQFKIGPKAGVTFPRISNLEQGFDEWENRFNPGFQAGIAANYGDGTLRFQPELLYTQSGGEVFGDDNNNLSTRWNYLQLPLLLNLNFGDETRFFVNVGPYLGYALSGSSSATFLGTTTDEDYEFDDDVEDDGVADRRLDVGGALGIGVAFDVGPGDLQVEARYNMGFLDLRRYDGDRPDNIDPSRNMVGSLSLAYLFDL